MEERFWSLIWMKSLLKSFYQMSKADQHEYMTLHNQFNNIQNLNVVDIQKIEYSKLEIGKIEQDPEKAEKILEICGIYSSNSFEDGFCVKMSRFNHSCQPNASSITVNDQQQLRAIENIKAGEEINISYLSQFAGFRNTKYRRQELLKKFVFICSCDMCENDIDVDAEAFEAYIQEAEKLFIDRQSALKDGIPHGAQYYSLDNCRKEILCYKKLYKVGKVQKIQPHALFLMLDQGFNAATTGYQFYETTDLKIDAMKFAKAAEKFGKFLGHDYVSLGNSFSYKQVYHIQWSPQWRTPRK
jgi:hypothetical protein